MNPSPEKRSLFDLSPGQTGVVLDLLIQGLTRRRLLDLGMVPGTRVEAVRRSPAGDPKAYRLRGSVIALREEEAKRILVQPEERD